MYLENETEDDGGDELGVVVRDDSLPNHLRAPLTTSLNMADTQAVERECFNQN